MILYIVFLALSSLLAHMNSLLIGRMFPLYVVSFFIYDLYTNKPGKKQSYIVRIGTLGGLFNYNQP